MEGDGGPSAFPRFAGSCPAAGRSSVRPEPIPCGEDGGPEAIAENLQADGVDGLIAIGGEDTLGAAAKLFERGVQVVGVPKTIDNDLSATDYTFGFDTAVNIAMSAIDRLHTTAESHKRTLICEVMGGTQADRLPRGTLRWGKRDPDPRDRVRPGPGL